MAKWPPIISLTVLVPVIAVSGLLFWFKTRDIRNRAKKEKSEDNSGESVSESLPAAN
jgi:cytoskeletal protein RodZ